MAATSLLRTSFDPVMPSKLRDPKVLPVPVPPLLVPFLPFTIPPVPKTQVLPREDFLELSEKLTKGSILFPGCKAYEQAIFIGNLLYRFVTPSAVVQAVEVEDVSATVLFAVKKGIKLTIKSGGHSMGGYCLNEGGIVLDISSMLHPDTMEMVKINDDDMTASIMGGAVWNDAYRLLKKTDLQLVAIGGNCPSVGVSAFLLGGGLSPFSRKYGLGIDNLLEMTVVTADGEVVTVTGNEKDKRKRDLFWAVRGGGGGNFGITVNVKIKLQKLVDKRGTVVAGNLTWKLDGSQQEEDFKSMMEVWNTRTWPEEVRGEALWHYDERNQLVGKMTMVYNGNWDACIEAIWPLLKFNPEIDLKPMHWTDWEVIDGKVDVFEKIYHHHASFIFGEGAITRQVTDIITDLMRNDVITKNEDVDSYVLWHHIGGATTNVKPRDTAFFWRDGFYVFHVKVLWTNPNLKEDIFTFFEECNRLREFSLQNKAAYLNYIDPTVKNFSSVYYGDNYPKLCQVKRDWDPNGFFSFPQGIRPSGTGSTDKHSLGPEPDWKSWGKSALPTPLLLGNPRTTDELYSIGAGIRRAIIGI